ncbi:hypothetical protein GCM10009624_02900 [Gordonia sinesedis]
MWNLDTPVPYPALGISMALVFGLAMLLISRPAKQDTAAAFDDTWTIQTPRRTLIAFVSGCGSFVLGGLWLVLLSRSAGFAESTSGRLSPIFALGVGSAAVIVFGAYLVWGLTMIVFSRHHSFLKLTLDDEHISIEKNLGKPTVIAWDDILDLVPGGPHRAAVADCLTIVYNSGSSALPAQLFLTRIATGLNSAALQDILDVRWRPDTQPIDNE